MQMKSREDIDTGWGMLGLEEHSVVGKPLQQLVDKVVVTLNDSRRLQLKITFGSLGIDVQDGYQSKTNEANDDVIELAEQENQLVKDLIHHKDIGLQKSLVDCLPEEYLTPVG